MRHQAFCFVVLAFQISIAWRLCGSLNPGFKTRISKPGLAYVNVSGTQLHRFHTSNNFVGKDFKDYMYMTEGSLLRKFATFQSSPLRMSTVPTRTPTFLLMIRPENEKASDVAIDLLTKDFQGKTLPDQHGNQKVSGIKVDYDLTAMTVQTFSKPAAAVVLVPGVGVTWSMSGGLCSIHGDWHYKARKAFVKWSDSGSFDIKVADMKFSVTVSMGIDSKLRPTIKATTCSASTGSVDVKFHGGASWLYNLFSGSVEKSLKGQLNDILCSEAKKAINVNAAQSLSTLDLVSSLGSDLSIDYSLTQAPRFTDAALETSHKGEIFFTASRKSLPFGPQPLPPSGGDKMLTIWLSDYIAKSAGYAAFKNNLLQYNVTSRDLSSEGAVFLNTTCASLSSNCIGKLVPLIGKRYPNEQVELDMYSTGPPNVTVTSEHVSVAFSGILEVHLASKNKSRGPFLFSANASMTSHINVSTSNGVVKGTIQDTSIAARVMNSSITNSTRPLERALNITLRFATKDFIEKQLNDLGQKGIPIPEVSGIKLVNSKISLVQNAIQVETDVQCAPSLSHGLKKVEHKPNALKFRKSSRWRINDNAPKYRILWKLKRRVVKL